MLAGEGLSDSMALVPAHYANGQERHDSPGKRVVRPSGSFAPYSVAANTSQFTGHPIRLLPDRIAPCPDGTAGARHPCPCTPSIPRRASEHNEARWKRGRVGAARTAASLVRPNRWSSSTGRRSLRVYLASSVLALRSQCGGRLTVVGEFAAKDQL